MSQAHPIINRVARSPLVSFDLADLYSPGDRFFYDLKDNLFQGMILKEKDFREFIKNHDWSQYKDKHMAVGCTVDSIIPNWAYMLLVSVLQPHAKTIVFGTLEDLEKQLYLTKIRNLKKVEFENKKVVVKGCGEIQIPTAAFVELTSFLTPIVDKLMFGEPCSTVPVYRRKKESA